MNETVNKFLLAGDTFIVEIHLKQPGYTYSVCGPFTKIIERIQKCLLRLAFNMIWLMGNLKI